MFTEEDIIQLYEQYGNKEYDFKMYCKGCLNCLDVHFPCLNCAEHVFKFRLGRGNDGSFMYGDDVLTEQQIKSMIKYKRD